MKLTKTDMLQIIGMIRVNYSYAFKEVTKNDFAIMNDLWFNSLKKYSKEVVFAGFQLCLERCKMPPTIADMVDNIKNLVIAGSPNELELWHELEEAIADARYIYNFQGGLWPSGKLVNPINDLPKVFDRLNPINKEYLGNISTLKDLKNYETLDYEKSRYLSMLPKIRERLEIKLNINSKVLEQARSEYTLSLTQEPTKLVSFAIQE